MLERLLAAAMLACCLFVEGCVATPAAQTNATLIINATLVSPERSEPLEGAWVRIEGDRITALGNGDPEPRGATIINANGGYLIPGLIDSHVHLYHATGLKRRYTENYSELYRRYMVQQPRSFLYHGFTTVIELNADAETNARFEEAPIRPRLFHCGQGVILSDGFAALEIPKGQLEEFNPGYLIDTYAKDTAPAGADPTAHTPEAVVDHVRQTGGQCIKLYYEEALWWPGEEPLEFMLPSAEIIRDVVRAAHDQNMPVLLHASTPRGHQLAVDTGVDILAHGMWEWPSQAFNAPTPTPGYAAIARAVANSDLMLQPTFGSIRNTASLFDPAVLEDDGWLKVVSAEYLEYLRTDAQIQRDIFLEMFGKTLQDSGQGQPIPQLQIAFNDRYERLISKMATQGANLLFGSDTAVGAFGWASPPGLAGYWEMQSWQRAGISLRVLFEAMTIDNAKAFSLDDDMGTIEVGKLADLLILRRDPLKTVEAYDDIDRIIIGGRVIARSELSAPPSN